MLHKRLINVWVGKCPSYNLCLGGFNSVNQRIPLLDVSAQCVQRIKNIYRNHWSGKRQQKASEPGLPARIADQRLCILHPTSWARSTQGRRNTRTNGYTGSLEGKPSFHEWGTNSVALGGITYLKDQQMPKALFDELKTCYSGVQIAELTFAVAGINAWNRIAISIHQSV